MVMLIQNCNCTTCNGGTPAPEGVFGGSHCPCPCHQSGHPIDSQEHMKWMKRKNREYLKKIIDAGA